MIAIAVPGFRGVYAPKGRFIRATLADSIFMPRASVFPVAIAFHQSNNPSTVNAACFGE